jgi:hypothetical protein
MASDTPAPQRLVDFGVDVARGARWMAEHRGDIASLLQASKDQRQRALAELVEPRLLEPKLRAQVRAAIKSSSLSRAHRRQLLAGVRYAGRTDYELAVPMMIGPLEAAYWELARDHGALLRHAELLVDPRIIRSLTGIVRGRGGNDLRHDTTAAGWRHRCIVLMGALLGWLHVTGALDAPRAVRAASRRAELPSGT